MHFLNLKGIEGHRHVLGLSGGKDSAALAVYIKDKYPELVQKWSISFLIQAQSLKRYMNF